MLITKEQKLKKLEDEEWREIEGSGGKYFISSYGRVKSFWYDKENGKILKFSRIGKYKSVYLRIKDKEQNHTIHKLVAEAFIPKPAIEYTYVTHIDWNFNNNHYSNLKWLTPEMSNKRVGQYHSEMTAAGKRKRVITQSRLKEKDIKVLKSMLIRGITQNVIAKMFNISEMQVTRIKRGENWGHVLPDPIEVSK